VICCNSLEIKGRQLIEPVQAPLARFRQKRKRKSSNRCTIWRARVYGLKLPGGFELKPGWSNDSDAGESGR